MRPVTASTRVIAAASLLIALAAATSATAQTTGKPPPRLPGNTPETSRIPLGVDTGTPMSSKTLPLGTPVPPNATVDTGDQRTRSAAARAAARPKAVASDPSAAASASTSAAASGPALVAKPRRRLSPP